jgi:hypothetical protein
MGTSDEGFSHDLQDHLGRSYLSIYHRLVTVEDADDIRAMLWSKLLNNALVNPVSAITGATVD